MLVGQPIAGAGTWLAHRPTALKRAANDARAAATCMDHGARTTSQRSITLSQHANKL